MFKIYIGTTLNPIGVIVSDSDSLGSIYEANDIPMSGTLTLNGEPLSDTDLNKSLRELGVNEGDVVTLTKKYASA